MKELSDDKFDALLRRKAESADFDFDESAWDKMEQKLRKKDRGILVRKAGLVLALLIVFAEAFLLINNNSLQDTRKLTKATKTRTFPDSVEQNNTAIAAQSPETVNAISENDDKQVLSASTKRVSNTAVSTFKKVEERTKSYSKEENLLSQESDTSLLAAVTTIDTILLQTAGKAQEEPVIRADSLEIDKEVKKPSKRRQLAFSVTALAGPEFSSIKSIAGNEGTLTVGFLINTAVSKKLMLSSGLKYGLKNYKATSQNYQTDNKYAKYVSGIDASCEILEIPVQASYFFLNQKSRKIGISSGLSSYLMLKEKYNFKYGQQSGVDDYLLVKHNANRHYLSVVSLSASYQIRPKSSNFFWAIEPFVKLPLGGVGEGNVHLKSSGVSLNLTYDLDKKRY